MARRRSADVIPLHAPRAATRLGPKEAHRIAVAARKAGLAPGTARELLAFLLRRADPRRGFTNDFRRAYLAEELGANWRTVVRATAALESSGLVIVRRGTGRTATTYTVNAARIAVLLGELPSVWRGSYPVHQGEFDLNEGCQSDTPPVANRHPTGDEMTPQGCQNHAPNAGARAYVRDTPCSSLDTPLTPSAPNGIRSDVGDPPPSGQGPPQICEHGLSSCRACGTNPRSQAAARAREELEAAAVRRREQIREQAEARKREWEDATPMPAYVREQLKKPNGGDQP